jgi:hypothetical protein
MVSVAGVRRTKIPPLAVHLTWTSLVLFTAAHLVLFRLHHPSRYTLYTLPLAFILTIGANTGAFLDRLKPLWKALPHWLPLLGKRGWGWLLLALAALAYTYAQGHYFSRLDMATLDPPDLQLMEFLRTLPENALVAGHPCVMDAVPLLARRKVLANHELSLPYYYGYYGSIRKRITDFFEAYYASSRETVEAFARGYGVDVLVVRKEHFDPAFLEGKIYYEPFNKAVKERLKEGGGFVLQTPALEKWAASGAPEVCFENRRYFALCF